MRATDVNTDRDPLSDMSLSELWRLFPIELVPHNDNWSAWYREEESLVRDALKDTDARIYHIGSTAVDGIFAKPVIDILVSVGQAYQPATLIPPLSYAGYRCMSQSPLRISFNKGYTVHGYAPKVYHLHLRHHGDIDEIYFRDYLNDNRDIALSYQSLKIALADKFKYDRDAYTNAKSAFVAKYTLIAKTVYAGRY